MSKSSTVSGIHVYVWHYVAGYVCTDYVQSLIVSHKGVCLHKELDIHSNSLVCTAMLCTEQSGPKVKSILAVKNHTLKNHLCP